MLPIIFHTNITLSRQIPTTLTPGRRSSPAMQAHPIDGGVARRCQRAAQIAENAIVHAQQITD